jgi:hypothetical protein
LTGPGILPAPAAPGSNRETPIGLPPSYRVNYYNLPNITLATEFDVTSIGNTAVVWPVGRIVRQYVAPVEIGLVAVVLSSSVVNETADLVAVTATMQNRAQDASIDNGLNILLSHFTYQNSGAGLVSPTTRVNSLAFGATSALKLPSNADLSLRVSGPNSTDWYGAAALTFFYVPLV